MYNVCTSVLFHRSANFHTISDLYGVKPSNCYAVNMNDGDTYALTDDAGCAVDADLFPDWTPQSDSQAVADFISFKWPDSPHIRFQCDCATCLHKCNWVMLFG